MPLSTKSKVKIGFFAAEAVWIGVSVSLEMKERLTAFTEARALADRLLKPLANIGCGGPRNLANIITPRFLEESDVNVDVVPRDVPNFKQADIYHLPFTDKEIGVAWVSHILEHLEDPDAAVKEVERVSDFQFFLVPDWWSSSAAIPSHRWIFTSDDFTRISNQPASTLTLLALFNVAVAII